MSVTLDMRFCLEALGQALRIGKPDIITSNQMEAEKIQISMSERGRTFIHPVRLRCLSLTYDGVCSLLAPCRTGV